MAQAYSSRKNEPAVSPVVGVMLMLIVTILIAAVVSGYSGSLIGGASSTKTPTLNMDIKIINSGDWHGSGFFATVTGVSDPIPTKNLKIVTSWTENNPTNDERRSGIVATASSGGNTTLPNVQNVNVLFNPSVTGHYTAPFGTGPGVNGTTGTDILRGYSVVSQQFGNYSLMQGTTMTAKPCGAADENSLGSSGTSNHYGGYGADNASYSYWVEGTSSNTSRTLYYVTCPSISWYDEYWSESDLLAFISYAEENGVTDCVGDSKLVWTNTSTPGHTETVAATRGTKYQYTNCGDNCIDPVKAVLGTNWYNLSWGNTVNVKVIYLPTGKVIFSQDVPVTED